MNVMSLQHRQQADALYDFVTCAAELLASSDEARRRRLENHLLDRLPDVRAMSIFDVFAIRNPALRAMLADNEKDITQAITARKPGLLVAQVY